jgi:RNA polymerase sigma factor (sigma-70 family)
MLTPGETERASDAELWRLVRQGSAPAFEAVVRRYQSLVCAVAYSSYGDVTLSEDIAQETFWVAWRERATLAQAASLRSWLCGIARNLANHARRRAARAAEAAAPLEAVAEPATPTQGPAEEAASREMESLVWQTLEQIPETYREALVLFYREQQSVAEVAAALELSEDAVKQRLSRGRGMLRERVAELVGETLQRSRPGRAFTVAVMAGLAALSAGTKTAVAGAGAAGTGAALSGAAGPTLKAAVGLSGGALGGALGMLGGVAGGWLGTWLPAQLAPTRRERDNLLRTGRRMLLVSGLFMAALVAGAFALLGRLPVGYYLTFWGAWVVTYGAYVTVEGVRTARGVKRLHAEAPPAAEPNDSRLRAGADAVVRRYRGRVFRSRATLFGLPLIDINCLDPRLTAGWGGPGPAPGGRGTARGWIAIGDDARGVLLAVGSRARGLIALGGRTLGVFSFGGVATGIVAFGGLALGVIGFGGLAVGGVAVGGLAVGWEACGGGAVAWDVACGGGAVARRAAYGGAAVARDYAVGGGAWAHHVNDEAARAVLLNHPLVRGLGWYNAHTGWCTAAIVLLSLLVPGAMLPLMYRRSWENRPEGSGP